MLKKVVVQNRLLLGILLLALILRVIGITHGFPFIFHPDESTVVRSALGIRFFPNPAHFDWPHFYIYLNYFLYMIFAKLRTLLEVLGLKYVLFSIIWNDELIFYLLTRLFSATLGALTLIPVYLAGKNLFGRRVGLLSALALALFPFHVWHSHYSLIDVPMVFWLSWGMYFSSRILREKSLKNYILAGFFVGLSTSTKYNGGLSAIVVVIAHILRVLVSSDEKLFSKKGFISLFMSGVFSLFGFAVGTPYALLDYKTFIRTDGPKGALWQFTNVGKVAFVQQIRNFFNAFINKFPNNFGYTFLLVYVLGVFLSSMEFIKHKLTSSYKEYFLFIPSLFFFFYISGFSKTRAHYYMIAYPFVALVVGYYIKKFIDLLIIKNRMLTYVLTLILFLIPGIYAARNAYIFSNGDTRILMYEWILTNTKDTHVLIYDGVDLEPVFNSDKVSAEIKKSKNVDMMYLESANGFLFISFKDDEIVTIDNRSFAFPSSQDKKIIEPRNKRGPRIAIFRLPLTYEND